jgi:hypothetical protein
MLLEAASRVRSRLASARCRGLPRHSSLGPVQAATFPGEPGPSLPPRSDEPAAERPFRSRTPGWSPNVSARFPTVTSPDSRSPSSRPAPSKDGAVPTPGSRPSRVHPKAQVGRGGRFVATPALADRTPPSAEAKTGWHGRTAGRALLQVTAAPEPPKRSGDPRLSARPPPPGGDPDLHLAVKSGCGDTSNEPRRPVQLPPLLARETRPWSTAANALGAGRIAFRRAGSIPRESKLRDAAMPGPPTSERIDVRGEPRNRSSRRWAVNEGSLTRAVNESVAWSSGAGTEVPTVTLPGLRPVGSPRRTSGPRAKRVEAALAVRAAIEVAHASHDER